MDPLSFTASLLALVSTAGAVIKTSSRVFDDLRHAPEELQQVHTRIESTRARLELVARVYESQSALLQKLEGSRSLKTFIVGAEDIEPLRNASQTAEEYLQELEKIAGRSRCPDSQFEKKVAKGMASDTKKRQRLCWSLKDKKVAMRLVAYLKEFENELNATFLAISVFVTLFNLSALLLRRPFWG